MFGKTLPISSNETTTGYPANHVIRSLLPSSTFTSPSAIFLKHKNPKFVQWFVYGPLKKDWRGIIESFHVKVPLEKSSCSGKSGAGFSGTGKMIGGAAEWGGSRSKSGLRLQMCAWRHPLPHRSERECVWVREREREGKEGYRATHAHQFHPTAVIYRVRVDLHTAQIHHPPSVHS